MCSCTLMKVDILNGLLVYQRKKRYPSPVQNESTEFWQVLIILHASFSVDEKGRTIRRVCHQTSNTLCFNYSTSKQGREDAIYIFENRNIELVSMKTIYRTP